MVGMLSTCSPHGEIKKGFLFDLPCACRDANNRQKCFRFHQQVFSNTESGFHICPFGYAVYFSKQLDLAYIGLKVNGISRKGKNAGEGVYLPSIAKERLMRIIENETIMVTMEKDCTNIRRMKDELLHGMEKILGTCRAKSESLLAMLDNDDSKLNRSNICQDLKTILLGNVQLRNLFYATRMRFDAALSNKCYPTSVYNKFFKARKMLHRYGGRDIPIAFYGASYSRYNLTASFEILPYLLLENAHKFSLVGGSVNVNFVEQSNQLEITISNIGPYTSKAQDKLCTDKERGEYSAEAKVEGSGIGLFTCQEIAKLNHLEFKVSSDDKNISKVNNVPYSQFVVWIKFPADIFVSSDQ